MERVKERESISRIVLLINKCKGLLGAVEEYSRMGFHVSAILTTEMLMDAAKELRERLIQLKAFGPERA